MISQILFTVYRLAASIVGLAYIYKKYAQISSEFKWGNKKILIWSGWDAEIREEVIEHTSTLKELELY